MAPKKAEPEPEPEAYDEPEEPQKGTGAFTFPTDGSRYGAFTSQSPASACAQNETTAP